MSAEFIVLHCSASPWGSAAEIDRWHAERGFKWRHGSIGYHWVVNNGRRTAKSPYDVGTDGLIEDGRPETIAGAHVSGLNTGTLGVCMIGPEFTGLQLHRAANLVAAIAIVHQLAPRHVLGHYETDSGKAQGKACPSYPMDAFRASVGQIMSLGVDLGVSDTYATMRERNTTADVPPSWRVTA